MTKRVAIADKAASILEVLNRSQKPMTAYDLLDQLRSHGITSPPTIYRALGRLVDSGKIHRLETLNAYTVCSDDHGSHDHRHEALSVGFAICDTCGSVDEFSDAMLKARLEGVVAANAFRPTSTTIEIHGVCARCDAVGPSDAGPR